MSLRERLQEDMKAAMRARESERLTTIRMLQAAIKQREVDERRTLEEAEILSIVEKLIKQRKNSATQFRAGQRPDLADKEEAEIVMLTAYLPEPLSMEALDALIAESISRLEAAGPKDMGKVMPAVMAKTKGRADGKRINVMVRELLK